MRDSSLYDIYGSIVSWIFRTCSSGRSKSCAVSLTVFPLVKSFKALERIPCSKPCSNPCWISLSDSSSKTFPPIISFNPFLAFCACVNYPLSKANGLPASQTSQPTISTGVNSGSPCPILLFLCYLS